MVNNGTKQQRILTRLFPISTQVLLQVLTFNFLRMIIKKNYINIFINHKLLKRKIQGQGGKNIEN